MPDVVVDVPSIDLMGRGPDLRLGVVLIPHVHPLAQGPAPGLARVQSLGLLEGFFQLCLGRSLTQDVFQR